jgi:hypothetical protein
VDASATGTSLVVSNFSAGTDVQPPSRPTGLKVDPRKSNN